MRSPRLLPMSKGAVIRKKKLENPLIINFAEEGNLDIKHLEMLNAIKN